MSGKKGGMEAKRGGNMTSCPAGSVSSSLDSLEKLFSLQLSGKKSLEFSALFECIIITLMFLFFPFFCSLPGRFPPPKHPPFNPLLYQI